MQAEMQQLVQDGKPAAVIRLSKTGIGMHRNQGAHLVCSYWVHMADRRLSVNQGVSDLRDDAHQIIALMPERRPMRVAISDRRISARCFMT